MIEVSGELMSMFHDLRCGELMREFGLGIFGVKRPKLELG